MSFAKDGADIVKIHWRIEQWYPELSEIIKSDLKKYHEELLRFNKTVNLVSPKTLPFSDGIHFADCILAWRVIEADFKGTEIHDFGSGNGFPGLVFAILRRDLKFKLVEIDQRKSEFLKHIKANLDLKNVEVLVQQVESLPEKSVTFAVSRGFAPITRAVLMARRLMPTGGAFYHMKGEEWAKEIADIPAQVCSFWQPGLLSEYRLPVGEIRFAIVKTEKIQD